ncbi:MAG: transposase [Firmicutes bacterium]|nr:transposase [Bacillota bacterium]
MRRDWHDRGHGVVGVDVGVNTLATLSTGEKILGPNAPRWALRRVKIRQRRVSRKMQAAKVPMGFAPHNLLPKGIRLFRSQNWHKAPNVLARTHRRIAHLRQDFLCQTSTRLCREHQAIDIETLAVHGMLTNHRLARAIADLGGACSSPG